MTLLKHIILFKIKLLLLSKHLTSTSKIYFVMKVEFGLYIKTKQTTLFGKIKITTLFSMYLWEVSTVQRFVTWSDYISSVN